MQIEINGVGKIGSKDSQRMARNKSAMEEERTRSRPAAARNSRRGLGQIGARAEAAEQPLRMDQRRMLLLLMERNQRKLILLHPETSKCAGRQAGMKS